MRPLLRCEDLNVRFNVRGGVIDAVSNVHLTVSRGECLGVLGESGSGKSQCFLAIMGLLSRNGSATGSVWFDGREIWTGSGAGRLPWYSRTQCPGSPRSCV